MKLILMGVRVAEAFGIRRRDYEFVHWFNWDGRQYAVVPHPSGINQWWNDPDHRWDVYRFFEEVNRDRAGSDSV